MEGPKQDNLRPSLFALIPDRPFILFSSSIAPEEPCKAVLRAETSLVVHAPSKQTNKKREKQKQKQQQQQQ